MGHLARYGTILNHLEAIMGHLGPSWVILAACGGVLNQSCGVLGASWGHLGASSGRLGASCGQLGVHKATERQTKKPYFSLCFSILLRSEAFLKPTWLNMASLTVLVPSWAHLGAVAGHLGGVLGPSWPVLGRLVAFLGRLVANLASLKPPSGRPKNRIFPKCFQYFRVAKPS